MSLYPWLKGRDDGSPAFQSAQRAAALERQRIAAQANERSELRALLERAADALQCYCTEANGDMNDRLAIEIYRRLTV